jgi:hypothetical protein
MRVIARYSLHSAVIVIIDGIRQPTASHERLWAGIQPGTFLSGLDA